MCELTRERARIVKKRMISLVMAVAMLGTLVTGCGGGKKDTPQGTETMGAVDSAPSAELESGTIPLTVWADAGSWDCRKHTGTCR